MIQFPAMDTLRWPPLRLDAWRDTYATLHRWSQIVGKITLALTPRVNHFWNVTLHLTSRGLITPTLVSGERALTIEFDFIDHRLVFRSSDGRVEAMALEPRTVADFYRGVMDTLRGLGVDVRIWTMPVEIYEDVIPFEKDTLHRAYDPERAHAFWRALMSMKPVFESFRCGFIGKCSPVHFFWGSFDLAVTRFSGRRAPERPDADAITREGYSHEVISHGFWPGGGAVPDAAFYAYAAPEPAGFPDAAIRPAAAYYLPDYSQFILPYEAVRSAADPERELTSFLETTYDRAADLGGWDRDALERADAD